MRSVLRWFIILQCFLLCGVSAVFSGEPEIFLCIDSMMVLKRSTGKDPGKLVYGYVNGQKTPCMSEHELRVTLSRAQFVKDSSGIAAQQQKTFSRNAIFRGEKNLSGADLRGMDLQGIDLSGANLQNAQLESVDLRNANLSGTNLTGANLRSAYCKNVNFSNADFTGADLQGAFFQNANMKSTDGLSIEVLCKTATLYQTLLDEEMLMVLEENYRAKLEKPRGGWVQKDFNAAPDSSEPKKKKARKSKR
ncbi:MAG: pentapeptide repeat-containing protein [Chitinispirillaceae bacterium]|nr:pentapeptide repeat-containing protein [Chitinispirillaceae bacterium]